MKTPTKRQLEILAYVVNHGRFVMPSQRQISSHFGIQLRAAQKHLEALHKKGFLPTTQK